MRRFFIAGNWKMNKVKDEAFSLVEGILAGIKRCPQVDIVVCPPFTFLDTAAHKTVNTQLMIGAQNVYYRDSGAYTGEISPPMLKSVGCEYVIIGHSERRIYFKETDPEINRKAGLCLKNGLIPILCVGETNEQKNDGSTFEVLNNQIIYGLEGIDDHLIRDIIIAYEPVWAIGTGVSASGDQVEEIHRFIRNTIKEFACDEVSSEVRIIYGGSVNSGNAVDLLARDNVDGALIGGASLKAGPFCEIVKIAESLVQTVSVSG
jgi:triosephosphate isomerase